MSKGSRKVWRGLGYFIQLIICGLGSLGLYLFANAFQILVENRLKFFDASTIPADFGLTALLAPPFAGLGPRLRFLIFLAVMGIFGAVMSLMNRQTRTLNKTAGAMVALVSAYVFAGLSFLCAIVFGVQWMVEIHLVGRIFISVGLLLGMYCVAAAGVRPERHRFLTALIMAVITLPAQFILLLPIYQYVHPNALIMIGVGLAGLAVNLGAYSVAMKKSYEKSPILL